MPLSLVSAFIIVSMVDDLSVVKEEIVRSKESKDSKQVLAAIGSIAAEPPFTYNFVFLYILFILFGIPEILWPYKNSRFLWR